MNDEKMVAALVFAQLQDPRDTLDQRARAAIFAAGVFETEWERHASARSVAADARYEARLAETPHVRRDGDGVVRPTRRVGAVEGDAGDAAGTHGKA